MNTGPSNISAKTRLIAGVEVSDTPLVNSVLEFCKDYYDDLSWNHVNRSWLFGTIIASKTTIFKSPTSPEENASFDSEIHAVSALLHDVSWDCNKSGKNFCSPDKRFEVDGANAAILLLRTKFQQASPDIDFKSLDQRKLQLVWDSIALHATPSIAFHKEPEVAITSAGIMTDFSGPLPKTETSGGASLVTWEEWDRIVKEFPRTHATENGEEDFKIGVKKLICALCVKKPESTHGTWMEEFGDKWVEGYKERLDGKRQSDFLMMPVVRPEI